MSFPMLRNLFPSVARRSQGTHRRKQLPRRRGNTLILEYLEERCLLAVFTVTTTDNAGPGSLRQAILDANANPGLDTIAFNIGEGGVQTIRPNSELPTVTDSVIIDGTTQPGFDGHPVIVLNGSRASSAYGLVLTAGGCTVRGLVIQSFASGAGLALSSRGGNVITGNYLGTDVSGTQALGNLYGIGIGASNNTIGGTEAGAGNLISGNLSVGIDVFSKNNVVQGNWIGTDITGTRALSNGTGVSIEGNSTPTNNVIGGTAPGARNLISGNRFEGILITSAFELAAQRSPAGRNVIQGNYIGTDVTGTQALANGNGIVIVPRQMGSVAGTLIGGTEAGAGNVISGNSSDGVFIRDIPNNVLQGNYIGTDSSGTRALGNQSYGVEFFQAGNNLLGGTSPGARNLISGNGVAGVHLTDKGARVEGNWIGTDSTGNAALSNGTGIRVDASGVTVGGSAGGEGNLISGNLNYGVYLTGSSNRVQGNQIGTNADGSGALRNTYGVYVVGGSDNRIGGVEAGAGNLISGNFSGVVIFSSPGSAVQGNRIGTDGSGTRAVGNVDGVDLNGPDNLVGGSAAGAGNLISGNLQIAVSIASSGNRVQGNTIGTTITGLDPLGNDTGVYVGAAANNNLVGGTEAGAGNLISGNRNVGVLLSGQGNVVEGNVIGTDVSGTRVLGQVTGICIDGGSDNLVGGTSAQARNLISGSFSPLFPQGDGVLISAGSRNRVEGNYIGTDLSGSRALGNRNGIRILGGQDNQIGGTEPGAGNLISGASNGIFVSQSNGALIQGNTIGTDVSGSRALGNGQGIVLVGSDNTLGGTAAGAGNLISGNGTGVQITGSENRVQGNIIGTNASGTQALPNRTGMVINSAPSAAGSNLIGGTEPEARNLISGNSTGIELDGGPDNRVQGNYIGTDVTGSFALGNMIGVTLYSGSDNLIGGTSPGTGNLISGNTDSGVIIVYAVNNRVQGNLIGTDATGTRPVANSTGVTVATLLTALIGGSEPGARNVISGNTVAGVDFPGFFGETNGQGLQGNYIGTDVSGTLALPNGTGVRINASHITIGGTASGAGNLISGNTKDGVAMLSGTGNAVQGNSIGVDVTGEQPLGNGGNGVLVGNFSDAASNNLIGGTAGGAGNTIAFNGQDGVRVIRGTGNAIRQNAIFSNGGLGIELLSGGNRMQAAPVVTSATSSGGITAIQGTLTSKPTTTFTIELFANTECDPSGFGEGERFLASITVTTDASGMAGFTLILAIPIDPGEFITATATDPSGNTSQFSNCVEVAMTNPPRPPAGGGGSRSIQGIGSVSARAVAGPIPTLLRSQLVLDRFFAAVERERRPGSILNCRFTGSDSMSSTSAEVPSLFLIYGLW